MTLEEVLRHGLQLLYRFEAQGKKIHADALRQMLMPVLAEFEKHDQKEFA